MDDSSGSGDPLVARLLPALVHEVNNTTQLLVGLKAMLALPGGEAMFARRADDLARASARTEELGFAMAVLATAAGADMLMARRDPRSVRTLWGLAIHALQRDGGGVISVAGDAPRTLPDALDGWQVAWSAASVPVLCAADGDPGDWSWEWREDGSLVGTHSAGASPAPDAFAGILERTPGLGIEAGAGRVCWLPRPEWFEAREPG